jgi:hypothetical protein
VVYRVLESLIGECFLGFDFQALRGVSGAMCQYERPGKILLRQY